MIRQRSAAATDNSPLTRGSVEDRRYPISEPQRHRRAMIGDSDYLGLQLLQDEVRSKPPFEVHLNTTVAELKGKGKLGEVVAKNSPTGEEYRWHPAGASVFAGLDPNTAFLKGTVELDRWGFAVADRYETSAPGIFATGACRAGFTKQLGAAVGEGVAGLLVTRQYLRDSRQAPTARVNP